VGNAAKPPGINVWRFDAIFALQKSAGAFTPRQGWERLCGGEHRAAMRSRRQACRGGGATGRKPRPPRMQAKSGRRRI